MQRRRNGSNVVQYSTGDGYSQHHAHITHSGQYPRGNTQVPRGNASHDGAVVWAHEHAHPQTNDTYTPDDVPGVGGGVQAAQEKEAQGSDAHAANGENSGTEAI